MFGPLPARFRGRLVSWGPAAGAFWFGIAWFFHLGMGAVVSPWRVLWAFDEDWSAGVMGFLFFKNAPWRFPLGYIPNYYEPSGTTVGFTDSVPSIAPLAKLIAPLMPNDFQYIGLYMCLSFGALGFAGERLVSNVLHDPWQRLLGGALFALSPVIAARLGHPTLCAMFVVVFALHLSLKRPSSAAEARACLRRILGLMAFAAGSHPY